MWQFLQSLQFPSGANLTLAKSASNKPSIPQFIPHLWHLNNWALQLEISKTKPQGEFIMWTNSGCECSAEWPFNNHWRINSCVPHPHAYLPLKQMTALSLQWKNLDSLQMQWDLGFLRHLNIEWPQFSSWWHNSFVAHRCWPFHCDGPGSEEVYCFPQILVFMQRNPFKFYWVISSGLIIMDSFKWWLLSSM